MGANGFFTFQPFDEYSPFEFYGNRNISLVAPYFADTDISKGIGSVTYEVHNDSIIPSSNILSQVDSLIVEHKQTQFSGKWLMVAEWKNVPPFGNNDIVRLRMCTNT